MIIVLLGKPGAGKGTQGDRLAAAPWRSEARDRRRAPRRGARRDAARPRGQGVHGPRRPRARRRDPRHHEGGARRAGGAREGAILDGVVRTVPQAEGLERVLGELGRKLDAVLMLRHRRRGDRAAPQRPHGLRDVPDAVHRPRARRRRARSAAARSCGGRTTSPRRSATGSPSTSGRPRR